MNINQSFWPVVASGVVSSLIVVLLKYPLGQLISMIGGKYSWTDDDSSIPEGDKYEWDKQV